MTALYRPDGTISVMNSSVTSFPRNTMQEDVAAEHYDRIDVRLDPKTKT
ncbi:hypothetical protein [Breoghania sp.]|nr:hypothetical protein [Breoghania sp.]MDJ0932761.1 hypothetical protein [Breoghania sp.]